MTAASWGQLDPALILEFVERFDQYGSRDAPFWIIGPEEAGVATLADFEKRLLAWDAAGRPSIMDAADFHHDIGVLNLFHQTRVDVQKTWRPLIRVLLTAKTG